jgi:hypothetical protein
MTEDLEFDEFWSQLLSVTVCQASQKGCAKFSVATGDSLPLAVGFGSRQLVEWGSRKVTQDSFLSLGSGPLPAVNRLLGFG